MQSAKLWSNSQGKEIGAAANPDKQVEEAG